jgi:hypothetical protein
MRNPWIAIMVAADNGRGLHLSADEIGWLAQDGAIETCAQNDVDRAGGTIGKDWRKVDPKKFPIKDCIVR